MNMTKSSRPNTSCVITDCQGDFIIYTRDTLWSVCNDLFSFSFLFISCIVNVYQSGQSVQIIFKFNKSKILYIAYYIHAVLIQICQITESILMCFFILVANFQK